MKFKTDFELLKSENVNLKNENRDFEKEIEKLRESEKLDFEKRKQFEIEISKSNAKIKALENENLVLKQTDAEKRKIAINRCSNLMKENSDLKFKIQRLESTLTKFSKGEKLLNMLLKNQFFVQNKKGLGFGFDQVEKQNSNDFKSPLNGFEKDRFGILNSNNFKRFFRNENSFRNNSIKRFWVPKGTLIDNNGLLYKRVWVPKSINEAKSGKTVFVRPLDTINI